MNYLYNLFKKNCETKKSDYYICDNNNVLSKSKSLELVDKISKLIEKEFNFKISSQKKIAILLPRNKYYIASFFAIWKLNCVVIPLNVSWPKKYLEKVISDSEPNLIIVSKTMKNKKVNELVINDQKLKKNLNIKFPNQSKNLAKFEVAYIIFTSGSTGEPKGVEISSFAYKNYLNWTKKYFKKNRNLKKLLITAELTFDITLGDIAFSLVNNVEIHISKDTQNIFNQINLIKSRGIDVFYSVPSTITKIYSFCYNRKNNYLNSIKLLISGGDIFSVTTIKFIKKCSKSADIHNVYGPTECTINCSSFYLNKNMHLINKYKEVPIGKIFSHLKYKLLTIKQSKNKFNKKKGELIISGAQLMNGYINKNSSKELIRLNNKIYYKTGDLVEKKSNYLFLIDRLNNLVKFKGYRFNPNYIDDILIKEKGIINSKTIIYNHKIRGQLIVSFVCSNVKNKNSIKKLISENVPSYISPIEISFIKKIPLNKSGKYDRNKLVKLSDEFFSK